MARPQFQISGDLVLDGAGLTIRKLIQEIAGERGLSFEEASEGIVWALKELLRTDMKPQYPPGKEASISTFD